MSYKILKDNYFYYIQIIYNLKITINQQKVDKKIIRKSVL